MEFCQTHLFLAEEAARSAGSHLLQKRSSGICVDSEERRDLKLREDKTSEEIIIQRLREKTDFAIISEERGRSRTTGDSRYCWIIDPLDGTFNYMMGLPMCCISIALWKDQTPLLGVVYDFNRDELFSGIANASSWMNGFPICVRSVMDRRKAVLLTGFPVSTDFSSRGILEFVHQVQEFKKIRLLGSAALSLAYVAAGRADVYMERDIKIWDVAAGMAIVQGAGGTILRQSSAAQDALSVFAGNPKLISGYDRP